MQRSGSLSSAASGVNRLFVFASLEYLLGLGAAVVSVEEVGRISETVVNASEGTLHRLEMSEQRELVGVALNRLKPHDRKILLLREFDCFDYRTIGQILGINVGTVRSRLSRARGRLKKELAFLIF
ncbi:RNA polymerase sigma factor [Rubripirellula reticaptiva]|uniref:RNA polymerase sigma factor RpoE n=1 Tax=Rubripirellula reticaptiva TaxID=2528013 RepID=A0A5C6ETI1_9BACT|nr:sigma-70 family RNA polymerase sigma factor [Rubripirellula reticaptiva]TWU51694.1 RNA polymerase sigma factor RpoE [Rubripirellula reticaptiva]